MKQFSFSNLRGSRLSGHRLAIWISGMFLSTSLINAMEEDTTHLSLSSNIPIVAEEWLTDLPLESPGQPDQSLQPSSPKLKRVLSLDGGGMRIIYSLVILEAMSRKTGSHPNNLFDYFIGTSVGTIVTTALVTNKVNLDGIKPLPEDIIQYFNLFGPPVESHYNSPLDILQVFWSEGINIFPVRWVPSNEPYDPKPLEAILKRFFGTMTLDELESSVAYTTFIFNTSRTKVYSKAKAIMKPEKYNREIVQLIRTATTIPTYFPVDDLLTPSVPEGDGGMKANNPSLLGLFAAGREYKTKPHEAMLFSIGTGCFAYDRSKEAYNEMGMLAWAEYASTTITDGVKTDQEVIKYYKSHDIPKEEIVNRYLRLAPVFSGDVMKPDKADEKSMRILFGMAQKDIGIMGERITQFGERLKFQSVCRVQNER